MGIGVLRLGVALLSGALFGLGLAVSGMADPAKVIGFLDVSGGWDPTLAFVMGGAILVAGPAFHLIFRRRRPVLAEDFDLPVKTEVDARLIGGSTLFGVGWGLSGFCPGPAVVALVPALTTGIAPVFAFVAAMVAGLAIYERIL
ncbi:MAG: YeeE/YedE family protein [Actinomycetota bacterium]|nr:YeeE/YedE family protein [Actinomycetota bacterium]